MTQRKRRVLMSCLHYWTSPFQLASHHLAKQFARAGWDVAYLSAPLTPLHLLKRGSDLSARWALYKNSWHFERFEGVLPIVPGAMLAPDNRRFLRSEMLTLNWPKLTFPSLSCILNETGFKDPDLFYLDNFYHAGILNSISPRMTCYHMADDYSGFPGYADGFHKVENMLCKKADLVAYPSLSIKPRVDKLGAENSLFLPNGVESSFFSSSNFEPPHLYKILTGKIAVYVGAMDKWFDQDLIRICAAALPETHFVLLGPPDELSESIKAMKNIHCVGKVFRHELPRYLRFADVGLIPFDVKNFEKLLSPVRPLKMLEYLASGLPVVSTRWRELEMMNAPIRLAGSPDEFLMELRNTLASDPEREKLIRYAADHDWGDIFDSFSDEIELILDGR